MKKQWLEIDKSNAISPEVNATSSTTTDSTELSTADSLLVALCAATYRHSRYACLLLQTPGGLLERWDADPADLKAYSTLAEREYDFSFTPSERLVTILKGRIAEGFIPVGVSTPGLDSTVVGWCASGFGLTKEVAEHILRGYSDGFNRAMTYHSQDMSLVHDSVKQLFGDEGHCKWFDAWYNGGKEVNHISN